MMYLFRKVYKAFNYYKAMQRPLFIEYMGDSPMIRILDYLLTERTFDFSLSDLARNANVGRATIYRHLDMLLKHKIILPSRIIGKAKLFKLNQEHPVIKKLIELDDILMMKDLKQRILLSVKQKAT